MAWWRTAALIAAMGQLLTAGCGANRGAGPSDPPVREIGHWPTYQLAPDHNAVVPFTRSITPWVYDAHARINGGLAVVGNTIFATTFAPSVIALDVTDGSLRWKAATDNVVMSTPIVEQGSVFVGTGTNHLLSASQWGRQQGDQVLALDGRDGRIRWQMKTIGEDMPSPVYVNGSLVFANGDGHAYAVRANDGRLLWRLTLDGVATMASATTNGTYAYVSTCNLKASPGVTSAINVQTGKTQWTTPYGNCDSAPTLGSGLLFVSGIRTQRTSFGYGYAAIVAALDPQTGHAKWTYDTRDIGYPSRVMSSERAVAGTFANGLYIQSIPTHDRLVAFEANSGRPRWTFHTLAPAKMSAVVRNGFVYIGDVAGCLYTLELKTGRLRGIRAFQQSFSTSPPVIVGNTIFVASGSVINAIPLRNGLVSLAEP